ncbi:hypothetical protein [Bacillus sp. ISL-57]|uniref:hypothetical protein n=1 Tax=Bacillus sp. ISL-57 TaxID=2819135 RepID=UPI001BEB65B6|nr:hypothetical protein [Bacillus sp. ISL-57]
MCHKCSTDIKSCTCHYYLKLNLQFFAEPDEPENTEPEKEENTEPEKEEKKGDDTPPWAKKILDLLQQSPQSNSGKGAAEIPVPAAPKVEEKEEEDHEEAPAPKKKSFINWLM